MEKRYQVFVSSTYTDLIEERNEAMQAILELDCMPAGMELFPAANDTQWNWIKKVIDESDYYVVIIGGRYGTISEITDQSYTEMEYRYATDIGKPVIAFLHENPSKIPSGLCETNQEAIQKLNSFKKFVQTKLCKFYSNPIDLGAKLSRSLTQLIKQYPAIGWVRANLILSGNSAEEVLQLKRKIETLEDALKKARTEKPHETEMFASGNDKYSIDFFYKRKQSNENENSGYKSWRMIGEYTSDIKISWDHIFSHIAPKMINPINSYDLIKILNELIKENAYPKLQKKYPTERISEFYITDESFQTIKIQFRALNLITCTKKGGDEEWQLTPYGDYYMNTLLAIKKERTSSNARIAVTKED